MQTKSSYRWLKWALVGSVVATFATACVVTEGDPDDFGEGGDGNTPTAGTKSDGGEEPTAGTKSTGGGGSGGQGTAGSTAAGGEGGEPSTYQAGLCVGTGDEPMPTMLPACTKSDSDDACGTCVKAKCCAEWQECYGDTPATACGWGLKYEDPGQYDCVRGCFLDEIETELDPDVALETCSSMCTNQCEDVDNGLPLLATSTLVDCSYTECADECFPLPE